MAKWDLSKLPEGRKPLPDEWFAERAQMQERIKGLEAELAEYKYVASAIDTQWAESQDEIADLKAKLAKAEAMLEREIRRVKKIQLDFPKPHTVSLFSVQCEYELMLAELTGGKDE